MVIVETSGALNNPGTSSVIRIKLISEEPLFVNVKHAVTFCERYERSPVVEYTFSKFASTTCRVFDSRLIEPSVLRLARGRIVYASSVVKSGFDCAITVRSSLSHFP